MPSDAFMELSTYKIMGETGDTFFGRKDVGGFEISSIDFHTGTTSSSGKKKIRQRDKKTGNIVEVEVPDTDSHGSGSGTASTNDPATRKGEVTITKAIDSSSPALFQRCCAQKKISWGIITIREPGDNPEGSSKNPWLTIEFRELAIKDFTWDVDPAATGDEALKMEKITFEFETMYVVYQHQLATGHHDAPSMNFWNFAHPGEKVDEIGEEPDAYD
jgi:type VI secretion system Hcp family effector